MSSEKFVIDELFVARLTELIEDLTGGPRGRAKFCRDIGISPGYLGDILKMRAGPSMRFITAITNTYPNVSINWLLVGKGEKFISSEQKCNSDSIVGLEGCKIVNSFKNIVLAKEVNQLLKEIEDIDEAHLREVKGFLRSELVQLKSRLDRRSGGDRRKEDIPELTPEEDRRSGIERRVAGLNR